MRLVRIETYHLQRCVVPVRGFGSSRGVIHAGSQITIDQGCNESLDPPQPINYTVRMLAGNYQCIAHLSVYPYVRDLLQ